MKRRRRQDTNNLAFYGEMTEPMLTVPIITTPLPAYRVPRGTPAYRPRRGILGFFAFIFNSISLLLSLALVCSLLLLFARFIAQSAYLSFGSYTTWLFLLSDPLVNPFAKYIPTFTFARYLIDLPTLAAMFAYLFAVLIARAILKRLAGRR
jgi:uncharacterized protein YggT (Ycf19 family)